MKSYTDEIKYMLDACEGWDSETKALIEAFDRGRDYQKKLQKGDSQ